MQLYIFDQDFFEVFEIPGIVHPITKFNFDLNLNFFILFDNSLFE